MGLPQILYSSKSISFPWGAYNIQIEYPHLRTQNFSASKIAEVINVTPDVAVSVALRNFENTAYPTLRRNLEQLWEWASVGGAWQFALDSALTANTTLNGAVSATATSVVVASSAGLNIGDSVVVRDSNHMEKCKIGNIVGTTITLVEALNFGYASGARFRHETYWPARLLDTRRHFVREKPPLMYDVELVFCEDMNS